MEVCFQFRVLASYVVTVSVVALWRSVPFPVKNFMHDIQHYDVLW